MKKYSYLLVLLLISGCKSYNDFISIEEHFETEVKTSLIDGRLVKVKINGQELVFLFDTGATKNTLSNIDAIGGENIFNSDNYSVAAKVKAADGSLFKLGKYKTTSISNPSIQSRNKKIFIEDFRNSFDCSERLKRHGIYGIDNFTASPFALVLDYDNNFFYLDSSPPYQDYEEIPAFFKNRRIYVFAEIDGEKYKLLLDTGNTGGLILTEDKDKISSVYSEYHVLTQVFNGKLIETTQLEKISNSIRLGDLQISEVPVTINKHLKQSNFGLQLINKFNWIIDFKNKKLYAMRNNNAITASKISNLANQLVAAINGELIVILNKEESHSFQVGDKVAMVNDVEVTSENICELKTNLNNTADWTTLNIVFK